MVGAPGACRWLVTTKDASPWQARIVQPMPADVPRRHDPPSPTAPQWESRWVTPALGTASIFGAVVGSVAIPDAWPAIVALAVSQLAVTGLGFAAPRHPVAWAVAVAAVCAGSALLDETLSELAYSGAIPWTGLSTAMATLNLYRRGQDWVAVSVGSAALVAGSIGLVGVSVRAGIPVATAILSTSVHILIGVICALALHVRDARVDRVHSGAARSDTDDGGETGHLAAARRALTIVALRGDELAETTADPAVRGAATDLRDVARRALLGPGGNAAEVTRIEVHPRPVVAQPEVESGAASDAPHAAGPGGPGTRGAQAGGDRSLERGDRAQPLPERSDGQAVRVTADAQARSRQPDAARVAGRTLVRRRRRAGSGLNTPGSRRIRPS